MKSSFAFRKMKESDRERMFEISSKVWDGNDFLPDHWDEWLNDDRGEFTAVEYEGELIGCGKLSFLSETDAWLGGLRKDTDFQVKGLGFAVTEYHLDLLRQHPDLTSLRLCTYVKEKISVPIALKVGFKLDKKFSMKHLWYEPDSVEEVNNPRIEKIINRSEILEYIHASPYYEKLYNLVPLEWTYYPVSDELIDRMFIQPGHCYCIKEGGQIKALVIGCPARSIELTFVEADDISYFKEIIEYLKFPSLQMKWKCVSIFLPDYQKIWDWIKELGFQSWEEENDVHLYSYPIELLKK